MTPPRRENRRSSPVRSLITVFIALGLLSTLLFSLVALTGTFGIGLILIVGVVFGFVGFHYFVWGKWLGPMIREDVEADEAAAQSDAEHQDDRPDSAP